MSLARCWVGRRMRAATRTGRTVSRRRDDSDGGVHVARRLRRRRVSSFDLRGVAGYIVKNDCRDIVVMCGAGISVSAGIPDFRTPGTGLYDNLQKYDLPSPQSIFELSYFRERPDAFYRLCAELWPDNYAPTPTHHFITELHARGRLRRCFTPEHRLARGGGAPPQGDDRRRARRQLRRRASSRRGRRCVEDRRRAGAAEVVKPDIVFFGDRSARGT